ncbi:hypothetical protein ABW05_24325 [Mycolicibacterium senegalense]|uniref:Uncharacterized protein n=1 Tax=Mycolicibacterium senegalense TaxID=1796 RepID=A0ABR5G1H7_9MYCO|nr:hypothetical protein AA982_22715 [Mycolicibacterium senegalense]KLO54062.1 hypothetical protein ABW05_23885 [Mycolicibacterium senegalense]KLO54128.1 hypothetical protein ABW05_24325 [Mycolicibacterium senegalense]
MRLLPDFNRRQRSATCRTCEGKLRFYPKPLDEAAMIAEDETEGAWAHLNVNDWINDPHPPDPQENTTP